MRITDKNTDEKKAIEEFEYDNFSLVISQNYDFDEVTGTDFKIPLYLLDAIYKARRLNDFFKSANLPLLNLTPFYKVMKRAMQSIPLTDNDISEFFALVANLWKWDNRLNLICRDTSLIPKFTLIGYVAGITRGFELDNEPVVSNEFGNLVYSFFEGNSMSVTDFIANAKKLVEGTRFDENI